MFIKSKSNYIVEVKVSIGDLLGCETAEEAYVVLKEMDTKSMIAMKNKSADGEEGLMNFFKEVLPSIIIKHNLYETEDKLMSNDDVAELIFSKLDITSRVMEEYSSRSFRSVK